MIVLILVAANVFLMALGSVDSTAFKVAAVLIGGLVIRASIAVAVGASKHGRYHGVLCIRLAGLWLSSYCMLIPSKTTQSKG